ncbi:PREDICTED: uncharacterized protein LOC104706740 [Camelina sativa]|uniref:Uncharacterized protein LOC104706740 n=1 Tax=Camelina sativa TaxID=90675 RepID=A0ABM0T5P9_CAMSA|nr:PREDICTED: uncharacterized protein LOC104706740 [Camelina sativa]
MFSTARTWESLFPTGPKVAWFASVWFKGRIPKHAFIAWINSRNRIHTRDRLIRWGLNVPSACLLCNAHDETRQHLFFDYGYSAEIWLYFTLKAQVSPPLLFDDRTIWLKNPSRDRNICLILRLAYQASMYLVWKERNSRLHNNMSHPTSLLITQIKQILRCHLDPLSRAQRHIDPDQSFLVTWFRLFD